MFLGSQNPYSYARQFVHTIAKSHGIQRIYWHPGGEAHFSSAIVKLGGETGFMKCAPGNKENAAFDALKAALASPRNSAFASYQENVAYPLKRFETVPPNQPQGNCVIYRYVDGNLLKTYLDKANYAERIVIINEVVPQLLQAAIYLYNAGIAHGDFHAQNIIIQKKPDGKLRVVLIDFDIAPILPKERKLLDANTLKENNYGQLNSYGCGYFYIQVSDFISTYMRLMSVKQPPPIVIQGRYDNIEKNIQESTAQDKVNRKQLSYEQIVAATKAYISLTSVKSVVRSISDCRSFIFSLNEVHSMQNYFGDTILPQFPGVFQLTAR
ncbi:hypothetical protein BDF22DRAFT_156966 [Syncephalis plumigaleata]|nr:hypothetical protein BDF22DRAFT_156966 [Syncephalis plumigaleata]